MYGACESELPFKSVIPGQKIPLQSALTTDRMTLPPTPLRAPLYNAVYHFPLLFDSCPEIERQFMSTALSTLVLEKKKKKRRPIRVAYEHLTRTYT